MHLPVWWEWELELTPHVEKRMLQRGFNEIDLRRMYQDAFSINEDKESGRWGVITLHNKEKWEIIVEPDTDEKIIVVVTAYPIEK